MLNDDSVWIHAVWTLATAVSSVVVAEPSLCLSGKAASWILSVRPSASHSQSAPRGWKCLICSENSSVLMLPAAISSLSPTHYGLCSSTLSLLLSCHSETPLHDFLFCASLKLFILSLWVKIKVSLYEYLVLLHIYFIWVPDIFFFFATNFKIFVGAPKERKGGIFLGENANVCTKKINK